MVSRKKIQAHLARLGGIAADPSTTQRLNQTISKSYSGFVHGAAPHVMELYGGSPGRFFTRSLAGTPREHDSAADLWNYAYRSLLSFIFAAKLYGAHKHEAKLTEFKNQAEKAMGKDYG